jgi:hypothetical protein
MSRNDPQTAWEFRFAIEHEDGRPITTDQADEFLGAIVKLAEARGLQVGGGYGVCEPVPDPLFPLRTE